MGYILPINNEQYNQYTNRIIRKDGSPFKVKSVEKITMRAKLKGKTDYEDKYKEAKFITKNYCIKKSSNEDESELDLTDVQGEGKDYEADLTGKGKNFNECV